LRQTGRGGARGVCMACCMALGDWRVLCRGRSRPRAAAARCGACASNNQQLPPSCHLLLAAQRCLPAGGRARNECALAVGGRLRVRTASPDPRAPDAVLMLPLLPAAPAARRRRRRRCRWARRSTQQQRRRSSPLEASSSRCRCTDRQALPGCWAGGGLPTKRPMHTNRCRPALHRSSAGVFPAGGFGCCSAVACRHLCNGAAAVSARACCRGRHPRWRMQWQESMKRGRMQRCCLPPALLARLLAAWAHAVLVAGWMRKPLLRTAGPYLAAIKIAVVLRGTGDGHGWAAGDGHICQAPRGMHPSDSAAQGRCQSSDREASVALPPPAQSIAQRSRGKIVGAGTSTTRRSLWPPACFQAAGFQRREVQALGTTYFFGEASAEAGRAAAASNGRQAQDAEVQRSSAPHWHRAVPRWQRG
jgi:hypothetical protein